MALIERSAYGTALTADVAELSVFIAALPVREARALGCRRMIAQKTRYALALAAVPRRGAGRRPGAAWPDRRDAARSAQISRADHARPQEGRAGQKRARTQGRLPIVARRPNRFRSARSSARWKGRSRWCPAPASISTRRAATATTKRPARSAAPSPSFATRAPRCWTRFRSPRARMGRAAAAAKWERIWTIDLAAAGRALVLAGAIASLLFMLLGCAAMRCTSARIRRRLPLDQRAMFEAEPLWVTARRWRSAAGVIGAVLLMLRRKAAERLMLVSLVAVVVWFAGPLRRSATSDTVEIATLPSWSSLARPGRSTGSRAIRGGGAGCASPAPLKGAAMSTFTIDTDQPGDAVAGAGQAHDRARDPRAQGRTARPSSRSSC